jgi:5-dehydro-2-deoxygluconokinase
MHPDDDEEIQALHEERVLRLFGACLANDRRLLLEVQATPGTSYDGNSVAELIERFYEVGVRPDWWKLPPNPDAGGWERIGNVVRKHDPYCAGLLVLGQALEEGKLAESFAAASSEPLCNGFAIGRSIYGDAARRWLAGGIGDEDLISSVAERYELMISLWRERAERRTPEGAAG